MLHKNKNSTEIDEFLGLLYKYVCAAGNYTRVKNEIGLRRAMVLKAFLCEYLECSDESVEEFAKKFFQNAPVFMELLRWYDELFNAN